MSSRALFLSVPFAAYLVALPDLDLPTWSTPLIMFGYFVGPYVIGAQAGWRALPTFAAVFVAVSSVHQAVFWYDDPSVSGMDDIPPVAGILLIVPLMLVPMALGALTHARRSRVRSDASWRRI